MADPQPENPPPTVLVVDDEPEFTELVAAVAEDRGFVVVQINDSDQFVPLYRPETDLVVLDLTMPGMDGIEIIRFLADQGSQASVILMSGLDTHVLQSAQELASTRGLQVLGALQKPIRIEAMDTLFARYGQEVVRRPPVKPVRTPGVDELREALAAREIRVHFQPKVWVESGQPFGIEALARWEVPGLGFVSPAVFIALAEREGLIGALTDQVIERSLAAMGELPGAAGLNLAINLSPHLLHDLDLPNRLQAAVAAHRLPPAALTVEVTESALVDHLETSLDVLTRLRMKGFQLSIDDFGTGYSSLVQLKRIPFTELKVDQSFVLASDHDEAARHIVESTIQLGRRLGLKVVAEGVETTRALAFLQWQECHLAQGYLIARPMPPEALGEWLAARAAEPSWPPPEPFRRRQSDRDEPPPAAGGGAA